MRYSLSLFSVGLAVFGLAVPAIGQVRIADTIGDAQIFNTGSQDRGESILGNAGTGNLRRILVRFDLSAFSAELADPTLELVEAELILQEQASRNADNGTLSGEIGARLLTQASGDWLVPGEHIPGEVWGATWANRRTDRFNPDAFARDDPGNNTINGDGRMRFASVGAARGTTNPNNGPAFGSHDQPDVLFSTSESPGFSNTINSDQFAGTVMHTFDDTNDQELVTIDLLQGINPDQLTATLNDWVTGFNAGLVISADNFGSASEQIFFESADGVNDGDGAGFALDTYTGGSQNQTVQTESGNGLGGALLRLEFGPASVPGDVNGDTFVNDLDSDIIQANFFTAQTERNLGDLVDDDFVDLQDFLQWKSLPQTFPPVAASAAAAIPEPTAVGLILIASTGFCCRRR